MPKTKLSFTLLLFALTLLVTGSAFGAQKGNYFYTAEAEVLGGYSQVEGTDGEFSSIDSWLFSPSWKFSDKLYWINVYNGTYNRSAQVIAQDEGGQRTNTTQSHSLSTSLKYFINDDWSLRPLFSATWVFVNETEDEDFGDGLYDYRDLSAGLESAWTTLKTSERQDERRLGFRFIDREYPNYQSLVSLFNTQNPPETDEKDLQGYKFNLSHDSHSKKEWTWGLEGLFYYKDYTDKKTTNSNGVLSPSETREDFVEYVNAYVSRPLNAEWTLRLDGQFTANQSNLDFYDTHSNFNPGDDDFIPDYFDYLSFLVKPTLIFSRDWAPDRRFVATVDYSFYLLHYPGRRIQNTVGRYQTEDQEDIHHTVSGRVSVPVTKNISWVSFVSYTTADSNQDFESFYLYSYDLWTAVTGVKLVFD